MEMAQSDAHEAGTRVCFTVTDVNFISVISEATQDIGPMDYRGGLLEEKICLLGMCLPFLLSANSGDRPRNLPRFGPEDDLAQGVEQYRRRRLSISKDP